jgi:hypothetical protein
MSAPRRCAFCGSTKNIEEHHLGGRQHAAFFTIPLCERHHQEVSIAIRRADAEMMRDTTDRTERLRRIVMACSVLMWQACKHLQDPRNSSHKNGGTK